MGEKHSAVGYLFLEGAFCQPKKQSWSAMSLAWTCFSIEAPFMKENRTAILFSPAGGGLGRFR